MGSNGVCLADKSTDELLSEFQNGHGGANGHNGAASANGNGNGTAYAAHSQAAFEEIVRRYAGMVYTVCLQVTRDVHDAEDATQAAFLTLALRAKTANSNIQYLGPWLQKVARRLSLDIMRAKKRRKKREERRGTMVREMQPDRDPRRGLDRAEMADIVRDELGKLPAKYRLPLILHYFGGLRPEEVARELGYKPSTLGVRLHRGRKMLAENLAERGITLTSGMLATILAGIVHIGISDNLVATTSLAAAGMGANGNLAGAIISARVIGLTRQATNAIIWAKTKAIVALLLVSSMALAGTTQALRKIAPNGLNLRMLDPTRLVQPLLRSLLGRPQFSSAEPAPAPAGATSKDIHGFGADGGLALNLAPGPHALRPSDAIGSAGGWQWSPASVARAATEPPRGFVSDQLAVAGGSASFTLAHAGIDLPGTAEFMRFPQTFALASPSVPHVFDDLTPATGYAVDPATRTALHTSGLRQADALALDSRPGALQNYVMSGQAQLAARQLTVGDAGRASFRQLDNSVVRLQEDLVLGSAAGGDGRYELGGNAQLETRNQYVGMSGAGQFVQTGGSNRTGHLSLAHNPGSSGAYALHAGQLRSDRTTVGGDGAGAFDQSGGEHSAATVSVGHGPHGTGTYVIKGGDLKTKNLTVGAAGAGSLVQTGGTVAVTRFTLGEHESGRGTAMLYNGNVVLDSAAKVIVGGAGHGTVMLGNSRGTATLSEARSNSGADLTVRDNVTGAGVIRGHGDVSVTGLFTQNGRVVADGYHLARELDFSSARHVTNTIDNPQNGGRNGWDATRGGKLVLPPIYIAEDRTSTWGEDPLDPIPDLVNSVRFTVRDVTDPGEAIISLISSDSALLPELPDGETFLGLWSFDREGLAFGDGSLLVRYDDVLLNVLSADESSLRMWTYDDDAWTLLDPGGLVRDPALNLISGQVEGDFRLFGVSFSYDMLPPPMAVPEPGAATLVVAGACALLRRRRRV